MFQSLQSPWAPQPHPYVPCCVLLQAEELQTARAAAEEASTQAAALNQLIATLQVDKASLMQQVKKLTADKASLQEQLGSSAGDIDMLQVRHRLDDSACIEVPCGVGARWLAYSIMVVAAARQGAAERVVATLLIV